MPSAALNPGFSVGLQDGGLNSMTLFDGSFSFYSLPRGTNIIAVTKPVTFVDSSTGSNRTESVGVNIEVPATNPTNIFYQMLQFKADAGNCSNCQPANCRPWCAIGVGTLKWSPDACLFGMERFLPQNGPGRSGGQVQVTVTLPNGVAYPIHMPGSTKHQNSGGNPANGTWTVTTTVCGQSKQASITVP